MGRIRRRMSSVETFQQAGMDIGGAIIKDEEKQRLAESGRTFDIVQIRLVNTDQFKTEENPDGNVWLLTLEFEDGNIRKMFMAWRKGELEYDDGTIVDLEEPFHTIHTQLERDDVDVVGPFVLERIILKKSGFPWYRLNVAVAIESQTTFNHTLPVNENEVRKIAAESEIPF